MPRFDLSPAELADYLPEVSEPTDFDDFWQRTLEDARALGRPAQIEKIGYPLSTVDVFDVTFAGFAGDDISGWYLRPAAASCTRSAGW